MDVPIIQWYLIFLSLSVNSTVSLSIINKINGILRKFGDACFFFFIFLGRVLISLKQFYLGLVLSQCRCLFHMVKTQISHPTFSPLISGFDWHTFFPLPRLFLMLLAVPVSLCNHQEPATLSMFAAASLNLLSFILPSFSPLSLHHRMKGRNTLFPQVQ